MKLNEYQEKAMATVNERVNEIIQEIIKQIEIPKEIAGALLSGILSDTLILNSPTTTNIDRDAVNNLSRIATCAFAFSF